MNQKAPEALTQNVTTLTFDCYGTLVDWETGILSAIRSVLVPAGILASDDQLLEAYAQAEGEIERGRYLMYRQVLTLVMEQLGAHFGVKLAPEQAGAIARSLPTWKAFPDTLGAMQRLRTRFKLGVISNVDEDLFAGTIATNQLPIDWLISAERCGSYKPSLNNFHTAMREHSLSPATMLHVAESLYHDVCPPCRELGVRCVWVHRRAGKSGAGATYPAEATPDFRVTSLVELADALGV